jgi:hypothetical protein
MRTLFAPLFTTAAFVGGALFAPLAQAQEATPSPAPATTAAAPAATPEAAATARPAAAKKPALPAAPAAAAAPVAPAAPGKASAVASPVRDLALAKAAVEDLTAAVDYQIGQAKRVEARGKIAAAQAGEISRARERATDLVTLQLGRVQKAGADVQADGAKLDVLVEEIAALRRVAEEVGEAISDVRTREDLTEMTLQEIARCFDSIAEKADGFVAELSAQAAHSKGAQGSSTVGLRIEDDGSVTIIEDGSDLVAYGKAIEVKEGETVNDAVSIGESVTVNGNVLGSAVALGGDVRVGKTGRVHGDASAVGGRIVIDDGGRIDGEQVSLGAGAAGALLTQFARPAPTVPLPLPTRIGLKLVTAAAQFLCFFLLGLLTVTLIPRRVEVVAEALAGHPVKSGAFGLLAAFLFLPIMVLLVIFVIIGWVMIPLVMLAYVVFGFVGFVALSLLVGRRIPTNSPLTTTGTLAIGAGLIVAVGLVPVIGPMVWFFAGFFALGAALMTRFGQDRSNGDSAVVPGGMTSIA